MGRCVGYGFKNHPRIQSKDRGSRNRCRSEKRTSIVRVESVTQRWDLCSGEEAAQFRGSCTGELALIFFQLVRYNCTHVPKKRDYESHRSQGICSEPEELAVLLFRAGLSDLRPHSIR